MIHTHKVNRKYTVSQSQYQSMYQSHFIDIKKPEKEKITAYICEY